MSAPRKTPCATCPYRKNVPSGVWDAVEYEKLPPYDAETGDQPMHMFGCHQADGSLCSGWVAYGDPYRLISLRIGVATGEVNASVFDYTTTVPLWESGAAAAEHGMKEIQQPGQKAVDAIDKLLRKRDDL